MIDVGGVWLARSGDDPSWAEPGLVADDGWTEVAIPGRLEPSPEGWSWLRVELRLQLDGRAPTRQELADRQLGVRLGNIDSAYELFAGGIQLGRVGALPPSPRPEAEHSAVFPLPTSAIADDGTLVLAVRVWSLPHVDPEVHAPCVIGPTARLVRDRERDSLPILVLSVLFGAVGLYHLYLFRRRRQLLEYLWFGLLATSLSIYCLLLTQWENQLPLSFVTRKKIENLAAFSMAPLFAEFLWCLLGRPMHRVMRAAELGIAALAVFATLSPGLRFAGPMLLAYELTVVPMIAVGAWLLVSSAVRGHPEARTLLLGTAAVFIAFLNDIALDHGVIEGIELIPIGFAIFVLSMALSLANRFARTHAEVAAQLDQILRRNRLFRFLPADVVEAVLDGDDEAVGKTERRWLTVLFADIVGFTSYADRVDPERLTQLLSRYLGEMSEIIADHDGTLDKFLGDGVMALWGAPRAMPRRQQVERALAAAAAMHQRAAELAPAWAEEVSDHRLLLRIGIHCDDAAVGAFGSESLVSYTAIGQGVNMASRLESGCTPGATRVSRAVVDLAPSEVVFHPIGEIEVKGFSESIEVYEVREASD